MCILTLINTFLCISSEEFVVNKNFTDDMSADEDFTGFGEVDVSEDGVTYESRILSDPDNVIVYDKTKKSESQGSLESNGLNTINDNESTDIIDDISSTVNSNSKQEAGDIPYSQYIKEKEAAEKQNTAQNGGESSPMADMDGDNVITMDMPDGERADILENTSIEVVEYDSENSPLSDETTEELKNTYKSKAQGILKALCEKFGIFKDYSNDNISLEFNYSRGSLNESIHKQNERSGNFSDFAKMLSLFDDIVSNAQPIECHSDKYVRTKRESQNLKKVYVLLSAFKDGSNIIPVELSIKEFSTNVKNKLYVSVTMKKIEADLMGTTPNREHSTKIPKSTSTIETDLMGTPSEQSSYRIPKSTSTYSLSQIIENINPSDGDFLKYIPNELLSEEQLQSKNEALEREETRLENMRNDYLRSTVSEETVSKRKESAEKLTKLFGLGLEWSESVKRGKYNPNSRTITLNPNLTLREMYLEVLKHEFTHDLENRKLYKKFKSFLFESSTNFVEFCEERVKELTGETIKGRNAVYALRGEVYMAYKNSKELTEEERNAFNRESAEREMVCDFVAKKLLAAENEEAAVKALSELAENQPTIWERFTQWLQDIIFKIKHSHNKTDSKQEMEYLERLLKRVYDSKVTDTGEAVAEHSIKVTRSMEWDEQLRRIEDKSLKRSDALYIGRFADLNSFDLSEFPLAIYQGDYRKSRRKSGNNKHYSSHSVPLKFFKGIKEHISESCMLIDNGGKVTLITDYIMSDTQGQPSLVILGIQKAQKMNEDTVNQVVSVYPLDDFKNQIIKAAESGKLIVKNKNKANEQLARVGIQPSERDNILSLAKDSLPQNTDEVKNDSSVPESHSIDMKSAEEADITSFPDQMAEIAERYRNGELTAEEYRIEVQDLLLRANEKYGTIEPGEKAENKTPIPKRVTSNKSDKTKRWVRTVHESGILPEDRYSHNLA